MSIVQVPITGIDMAYWAELIGDTPPADASTPGVAEYGAPKLLPALVSATLAMNSQTGNYWASNVIQATAAQLGDMTLSLQAPQVPSDVLAKWYGWDYEGNVLRGTQMNPIDMAFGYRLTFSDKHHLYVWVLKVKPGAADLAGSTKTSSINFQDGTIPCAVSMRFADGLHMISVDDSNPPSGKAADEIEQNFFTDPNWALQ